MLGREVRLQKTSCPNCQKELDAASGINADITPKPGDYSICLWCGTFLKFTDTLDYVMLDAVEFAGLPNEVQRTLLLASHAIDTVRRKRSNGRTN